MALGTGVKRTTLDDLHLPVGKRARMYQLLFGRGIGNGTVMNLPIDQGLEHGPRDFFSNPDALDPNYELRLAEEGNFNAIAFQIGLASRYLYPYAGRIPVILKLNGKTEIPADKAPRSPMNASVEEAVRLGAAAVGYTLYVGSAAQAEDFETFAQVRAEAERYGMPVIVWSYPRGEAIDAKGGRDSLYAIDYAARVANELGADVVKINFPVRNPEKDRLAPKPYNDLDISEEDAVRKVVKSGGNSFVIFSGGEQIDDTALLHKVEMVMDAGATGLIFGRNIWQRPLDHALDITRQIREIQARY